MHFSNYIKVYGQTVWLDGGHGQIGGHGRIGSPDPPLLESDI